jgi:hypothetical protein
MVVRINKLLVTERVFHVQQLARPQFQKMRRRRISERPHRISALGHGDGVFRRFAKLIDQRSSVYDDKPSVCQRDLEGFAWILGPWRSANKQRLGGMANNLKVPLFGYRSPILNVIPSPEVKSEWTTRNADARYRVECALRGHDEDLVRQAIPLKELRGHTWGPKAFRST